MSHSPSVKYFYHKTSGTLSYVVYDPKSLDTVVIDPVLDFKPNDATTSLEPTLPIINFINDNQLKTHFILETHAHADHLSSAYYLKEKLNDSTMNDTTNFASKVLIAIGKGITNVQNNFKSIYNLDESFKTDGRQFDRLLEDGENLNAGSLQIQVMATPGHTNDSLTYIIGDAAFIGDTLFHPDTGSARCDFPGGNADELYSSIHKILSLPENTRLFLCHDYPKNRDVVAETSIASHKQYNLHIKNNNSKENYIKMREERDATLGLPQLMIPSIQVNINAGKLPEKENNGVSYLKYPLNLLNKK